MIRASAGITDEPEQPACPLEFSPFHVVNVLVIEVKAREHDANGTEGMGCEYRPVTIGESPEVMEGGERPCLGGADDRSREPGDPIAEQGDVVTMGMDNHHGPLPVHREKGIGGPVKVGKDCIRPYPGLQENLRRSIRSKDTPRDPA
jgi:hypothetical protein